jgi:hypothetical protein
VDALNSELLEMKSFKPVSKIRLKALFVILASKNPENEQDLLAQLNTWVKSLPENYDYLILRGWSENQYLLNNNTLFVPIEESYENMLAKTILGINWICNNIDFEFLVRTNVSTFFSIKHIEEIFTKIPPNSNFLGGYIEECKDPSSKNLEKIPYIAGTALVMSKSNAILLSKMQSGNFRGLPEDLSISMYLKNNNVKVTPLKRNNLSSHHFFIPTFQIRAKTSKNSALASKRMNDINDYFKETSLYKKIFKYIIILFREIGYSEINSRSIPDYFKRLIVLGKNYSIKNKLWK